MCEATTLSTLLEGAQVVMVRHLHCSIHLTRGGLGGVATCLPSSNIAAVQDKVQSCTWDTDLLAAWPLMPHSLLQPSSHPLQ